VGIIGLRWQVRTRLKVIAGGIETIGLTNITVLLYEIADGEWMEPNRGHFGVDDGRFTTLYGV
jgi:hypothetical protein